MKLGPISAAIVGLSVLTFAFMVTNIHEAWMRR